MAKLISIEETDDSSDKRFIATFMHSGKLKHVKFGLKGGSTYIDHHNKKLRDAYIARHSVLEDFTDYMSPGALSRYILWERTNMKNAIKDYKKRFKL